MTANDIKVLTTNDKHGHLFDPIQQQLLALLEINVELKKRMLSLESRVESLAATQGA